MPEHYAGLQLVVFIMITLTICGANCLPVGNLYLPTGFQF